MGEIDEIWGGSAPPAPMGETEARRAAWWARGNCKRCHGRGRLILANPGRAEAMVACPCVARNLEKSP